MGELCMSQHDKIYCEDCGNKLTKFFSGKYNAITGKREFTKLCEVCNVDLCKSNSGAFLDHDFRIELGGFFSRSYEVCNRCGEKREIRCGY